MRLRMRMQNRMLVGCCLQMYATHAAACESKRERVSEYLQMYATHAAACYVREHHSPLKALLR
jgi:hypothetical protein